MRVEVGTDYMNRKIVAHIAEDGVVSLEFQNELGLTNYRVIFTPQDLIVFMDNMMTVLRKALMR